VYESGKELVASKEGERERGLEKGNNIIARWQWWRGWGRQWKRGMWESC